MSSFAVIFNLSPVKNPRTAHETTGARKKSVASLPIHHVKEHNRYKNKYRTIIEKIKGILQKNGDMTFFPQGTKVHVPGFSQIGIRVV